MDHISDDLIRIMEQKDHIDISRYDDAYLLQCLNRRLGIIQVQDASIYLTYLAQNESERGAFVQSLANNYTEFFRTSLVFAQLEHWILPTLTEQLPQGQELRIWSAGCSSGQEPYSLAILLENLAGKKRVPLRYRIFATDISASALETARRGIYTEESIQCLRLSDLNNHFDRVDGDYSVSSALRKSVSFSFYDLFDPASTIPPESIFGNFHLVICSNVLLYYNPCAQQTIVKKLTDSLVENGYLITGEAERIITAKCAGICAVSPPAPIFKKVCEVHHETK